MGDSQRNVVVKVDGRPFVRTAKSPHELYEEKLTLRVGSDELVFYAEKSEKSKNKQFTHAISVIDFSKDEPFSGSTTNHFDALPPSSSPEHEDYLSRMTLLCEISTSRSQENVHPSSIPVEDSDPVQEEIDIFLVPDDLIPPGVENDDFEDEDNSTFLPENESSILEPSLLKLILALVHAARRLRRYFQAYTITVLTNTPIKQILTRPEKTGRVAKWAIKLGEHDIVFLRREEKETSADFLVEIPSEDNESKDSPGNGNYKSSNIPGLLTSGKPDKRHLLEHVRMNQNKKADTLSKLASMTFEHLTKEVLVKVLTKRRHKRSQEDQNLGTIIQANPRKPVQKVLLHTMAQVATPEEGTGSEKRCGYFFRNCIDEEV
ncbi:hypothetical protein Tco_0184448 [Tanacetum coccineum]